RPLALRNAAPRGYHGRCAVPGKPLESGVGGDRERSHEYESGRAIARAGWMGGEAMGSPEVIIIGAGLAGAATARALVAAGVSRVLLIDREPVPGAHSSGRNAGMVRRAVEDPEIAPLAAAGAAEIDSLDVPFRQSGSFLIATAERLRRAARRSSGHRIIPRREAAARVPLLEGAELDAILETPADGGVEVHARRERYLEEVRAGGGEVRFGLGARAPRIEGGRVRGIDSDEGMIRCRHLVIAAGAWAGEWGEMAGIPVALEPCRRHLISTRGFGGAPSRDWPWVWDLEHGFYFRPESAGFLWSPCDEIPDAPGDAVADAAAPRWLAEKVAPLLPRAGSLEPLSTWAGHRTFTPDRRFLLGPDPRLQGWHWAAGLGGHGVTVSAAIGARVARALLRGEASGIVETAHLPREAAFQERIETG
ncbi:MAG: NAD(P)/FAD-dependent oxidoreductase, partial [Planctomycetota bacterium]